MERADYGRRLAQTRARIEQAELGGLLVANQQNRRYLTGFTAADGAFTESAGWVIITATTFGLITGTFHLNGVEQEIEPSGVEVLLTDHALPWDVAVKAIEGQDVRRLGFEKDWLSFDRYARLRQALPSEVELVPCEDLIERVRERKDAAEVDAICRAAQTADRAFARLVKEIKVGMTEREVAARLEAMMLEEGAEGLSFPIIVACGPGSALPHAVPSDRPVRPGEPFLIDFGCRVDGYCSDCTRTFCIGKPDPKLVELYDIVRRAQDAAVAALRSGLRRGRDVDAAARQVIEQAGYKDEFMHGLGHGVGLAIHELPALGRLKVNTPEQDAELARAEPIEMPTVLTNEPGIYLAGWGGVRLEDLLLVRDGDVEILTERNPERILSVPRRYRASNRAGPRRPQRDG